MLDYIFAPDEYLCETVLLRSYRPGDGLEMNTAVIESYEHLAPWMPWATEIQSPAEAERLARSFRGRFLLSLDFTLAIRSPDDRRYLGGCGYHLREGPVEHGKAEIGMWVRSSAAGRGVGTAALRGLIDWGFTEWPWRRLSWRCDANNRASRRVAEKAGMREEGCLRGHERTPSGEMRDTVCYAILKEEWTAAAR